MPAPIRLPANAVLPECDCPVARHEHGTLGMYGTHKCRCEPCGAAKTEQRLRLVGESPNISSRLARQKIKQLLSMGFTRQQISRACGVSPVTLRTILNNRKAIVRQSTQDAIMAVQYTQLMSVLNLKDGTVVDGSYPRAQLQELYSVGWSCEAIHELNGTSLDSMYRILRGYNSSLRVAMQVNEAYEQLRFVEPPQDDELARSRVRRTKKRAEQAGWDGMMTEEVGSQLMVA